jgi:hypothetical protein
MQAALSFWAIGVPDLFFNFVDFSARDYRLGLRNTLRVRARLPEMLGITIRK